MRLSLIGLLLLAAHPVDGMAQAPDDPPFYASAIYTKGYVVGAKLVASGLLRNDSDTTWTHLGHSNPRVNALSYDPARPDTLFTAAGNGVHRSFDGGFTWRIVTDWRVTEVQDVAVDPNAPQHVYLGSGYGIWRSDDYGQTWEEANAGIPHGETYVESLEVDLTTTGRIVAGTDDGVFVSEDAGASWSRTGGAGLAILDIQQSRANTDLWLAATFRNGLLLSNDGARTWKATGPRSIHTKTVHGVSLDPSDVNHMVAAGWDTGVLVSENGGRTWVNRTEGLPVDDFYEIVIDADGSGRIWAAPVEEGLFRSDDRGRTWVYAGLTGTLIFDLAFQYPHANR